MFKNNHQYKKFYLGMPRRMFPVKEANWWPNRAFQRPERSLNI